MKITVLSIGEPIGADAVRLVSKTVKWHARPGKLKRGGKNQKGTGAKKARHYTSLLAAQALSYGWLNGKRLSRRKAG